MEASVEQIMVKDVYQIDASESLRDAERVLIKHKIRHLPVSHQGKLIGMLSRTDVMRLSFGDTYGERENTVESTLFDALSIRDVMTQDPRIVSPKDSVEAAAQILISEEYHALPVSENGKLVGIITTTDIIKHLLHFPLESQTTIKKVENKTWGNYEQLCQNALCSVKLLHVKSNQKTGLRYHKTTNKFWRVIEGEAEVEIDEIITMAKPGDEFHIPAKIKHQVKAKDSTLSILEICYGPSEKKDVVRIIDESEKKKKSVLS